MTTRDSHPRLDQDAARLLTEAAITLDSLEGMATGALLDGGSDALAGACESAVVLSARARRFVTVATHFDLESAVA
jgi:hypothetical protein